MCVDHEASEDFKEPKYYELCDMLRAWTGSTPGVRQTLMITRSGYGEEDSHLCVPKDFSYRSDVYGKGGKRAS